MLNFSSLGFFHGTGDFQWLSACVYIETVFEENSCLIRFLFWCSIGKLVLFSISDIKTFHASLTYNNLPTMATNVSIQLKNDYNQSTFPFLQNTDEFERKIFIQKISSQTTKRSLQNYFSKYSIDWCAVPIDQATGKIFTSLFISQYISSVKMTSLLFFSR